MTIQTKTFVLTPVGTADYPYLSKPDNYQQKGDIKYKVTLKLGRNAQTDALFEQLTKHAEAIYKQSADKAKKAGKRPPQPAVMPMFETDAGYSLKASLKATGVNGTTKEVFTQAPRLFDNRNKAWDKDTLITGGSKIRLNLEVVGYDSPTAGAGITLRLKDVQVVELGTGSFGDDSPFGAAEPEQQEAPVFSMIDGDDDGDF